MQNIIKFNEILPDTFPYLNEGTKENIEGITPNKYFLTMGTNIPEEIKLRLIEESKLFQPYLMGFNLTLENFTNFSSIEEMHKHLQSSSYGFQFHCLV